MPRRLRRCLERFTWLSIITIALPTAGGAAIRVGPDATASAPALPPAVTVRLKPSSPSPDAWAPDRASNEARQAAVRDAARALGAARSPRERAGQLARAVELLGMRRLPDLGRRAVERGARRLVAPFAGLPTTVERFGRTYRLEFDPGADVEAIARDLRSAGEVEDAHVEGIARLLATTLTPGGDPARFETNVPIPDDPLFVSRHQWGLRNNGTGPYGGVSGNDIRVVPGWGVTQGNTSVVIGIVDTGVDFEHPDLDAILFDGSHRVRAYNGTVNGPQDEIADSLGHGTLVAGVAAAITYNGAQLDGRGVAGVCGGSGGDSAGCRIVSERVTSGSFGEAYLNDLAAGIIKAWLNGARAINVSFGYTLPSPYHGGDVLLAIQHVQQRGATVVCGAGNGQDDTFQFPGAYAQFGLGVSVAALTPSATLATFSSRGRQIDVAAPGEHIWSTYPRYPNAFGSPFRNYIDASGTSFAAPFVTGMAGLALAVQPTLYDNEFQFFLRRTAADLGAPGRDDTFGYGRPDSWMLLLDLQDRVFRRGIAQAQTWTLVGRDTVTFFGSNVLRNGCVIEGTRVVDRWEVRAHVELPCLSYEVPRVVVRTHGTTGWPNSDLLGFDLGGGEVVPGSETFQGFDVRTWVYDIQDAPGYCPNQSPQGFVPTTPANVQIAWSALGVMDTTVAVAPGGGGQDTIPWNPDLPEFARAQPVSPNPTHDVTTFRFTLPEGGTATRTVSLEIFDAAGRRVRSVHSPHRAGGTREMVWDVRDESGARVGSGVYFARLSTDGRASRALRVVVLDP